VSGRLDGKVAIVTGAASGMGRATALLFASEGARVVLADITDDAGEAAAELCRERGGEAAFHHTDVTVEDDVAGVVARATELFGGLDVFHSHAGGGGGVDFDATEEWDQGSALSARSGYFAIKYGAPAMRRRGGGSIILTSSVCGLRPLPHIHAYNAFKAALIMLAQSAAQMLGPDSIRVNAIAPGWIITPALVRGLPGDLDDAKRIASKAQPIPRHGRPEDIASCALFLASDESSFITGITIPVDGGWLSQGLQTPACEAEVAAVVAREGKTPEFWGDATR
jgi:NAD(P)-dependent dehydrogenase (short-subunit alcohol dehydrogenase family)